jgi:pimeloyl-ACP methyl ester carboxylesterase
MRLLRRALKTVLSWRLGRVPPTSASRVALAEPEATLLAEYMYQNLARPTCGEQAMTTLVSPGSARAQVVGRALGPRLVANPPRQPVSFIYGGEADWMDVHNAHPLVEAGAALHVATLQTAGHHVMLDDPAGFNAAVLRAAAVDPNRGNRVVGTESNL